jgi:hypothetical protein
LEKHAGQQHTGDSIRLAREIGGDSLQVSAVAGLASNPAGYKTALAVEKGSQL